MSKRENEYSKQLTRKSIEELMQILNNHSNYVDGLLQALVWEIGERGVQNPLMQELQTQIDKRNAEEKAISEIQQTLPPVAEIVEVEVEETKDLPTLFSQTAILGFTLFFSPITGGILLSLNLARLHKKGIWPVLLFALIFSLFQGYVSMRLDPGSVIPILLNVAGGLILSEFIWNNFIGKGTKYQKRNILIPLLILLAIFIPIAWYLFEHPEILNLKP